MITRGILPQYIESETIRHELLKGFERNDAASCLEIINDSIQKSKNLNFTNSWITALNGIIESEICSNNNLLKASAFRLLSLIIIPPEYSLEWSVQIFNTYYSIIEEYIETDEKIELLSQMKEIIIKYGEIPIAENYKEVFFKLSRLYYSKKMFKDAETVIMSVLC